MTTAQQLNERHYRQMGEMEAQLFFKRLDTAKQVPKNYWLDALMKAHFEMGAMADPNHYRPKAFRDAFIEKGQLLLKKYGAN